MFLAVHDAKNPIENERPRVSLLRLPTSVDGINWKPLTIDWSAPQGMSSDLESIARIPGTNSFLLVESGEMIPNLPRFRRVFLLEMRNQQAVLSGFTELPATVKNVEGSTVVRLGNRLIFLFAERAGSQPVAEVFWTELQLQPFKFGSFRKTYFKPSSFTGQNKRPVSAIETDSQGQIYIASAYDPDDDNGPFASVIWRAGRVYTDSRNRIRVIFPSKPQKLATLDGLKVESLAIREAKAGSVELFAGTDDENYGGALRMIPLKP